ncbi:MAG: hypothetical protein QM790_07370 [Nibricoccus sp.]
MSLPSFAMELAWSRPPYFAPPIVIRRLLPLFFLCCCVLSRAQEASAPRFSGGLMQTDPQTGELVGTEHPQLEYEGVLLVADELRFSPAEKTVIARGHVVLTIDGSLTYKSVKNPVAMLKGAKRLLADEVKFRLSDRTFSGTNVRLGEYPLYISGSRFEGNPQDTVVHDVKIYYREPGFFSPALSADTISIMSRENLVADKARLAVGNVPALPFHRIKQSVRDPLISHMSARIGSSGSVGPFAELGLHLPFAPGVKVGGDVGLYPKRGLLLGPSGTYVVQHDDSVESGSFDTGYIHDYGDKSVDILNRPIQKDRGFVQWRDDRSATDKNFNMKTQLNFLSDSAVLRDFRPDDFNHDQQPDSFVDFTAASDTNVASLFFQAQPNTDYRVQQRLPEVRVDSLPTLIGNNFYTRGNLSFVSLREREFTIEGHGEQTVYTTYPTAKSNRLDWLYAVSRPIAPREWLMIDPVAAARVTHYFDAVNGRNTYTRGLGEVGVDASLRASGVYSYKNERWGIDGIRHLVTPKLSYRYIPSADKGKRYIPQIDDRVFDTSLPTLELADQRNIDDLDATNVLRLGIDNTFQTRDGKYGSRDLLTLNVAGDYRFHRNIGEKDVSAIHTGFSLTPARWIQFDVYNSFTPQNYTLHELNTRTTLLDGSIWSVSLSTHYLQHQIEEYITEGRYNINEVYQLVGRLHYDARRSRFNEQAVMLRQTLDNVWNLEYSVHFYEGRSREGNYSFNIGVRLIGL